MFKKFVPYAYFIVAVLLGISGFTGFFDDKEKYALLFGASTSSKYIFLGFRIVLALLIVLAAIQRLKQSKIKGWQHYF